MRPTEIGIGPLVSRRGPRVEHALPVASPVDHLLRGLSRSANKGRVWVAAAGLGLLVNGRTRRAALRGIGALGATSLTVNAVVKPLIRRRRPEIELTPVFRRLTRQPWTTSFPSGHAASAAAFATGAALELPVAGLTLAPIAAAVGYSRIHVGVHHTSDVVIGAALGAGVALLTQRWWPVQPSDIAEVRTSSPAPALSSGAGLVVVVNPEAGDGNHEVEQIRTALPETEIIEPTSQSDLAAEFGRRSGLRALGVVGGDGTVASVAAEAVKRDLPLALFPGGTLNHFARDVGIKSFEDTIQAIAEGQAISVDVAIAGIVPFVNTASIGAYPEMVRRRDRLAPRVGKWVAMAIATAETLRDQQPIHLNIDGEPMAVWTMFVGNGKYVRHGPLPVWRPRMDDGLLDVQILKATTLARTRAALIALAGISRHSGVYRRLLTQALQVESRSGVVTIARDGEPGEETASFEFGKLPGHLTIYHPAGRQPAVRNAG